VIGERAGSRLSALVVLVVLGAGASGCAKETPQPAKLGQDSSFLVQMAMNEYRAGRYEAAVRSLEQARAKSPNDRQIQYLLGVVLIERGEYGRAIQAIDEGLAVAPNDPELLNVRGIARMRDRQYDAAIQDFEAAIAPERHYATPETALANLAATYVAQGRTDDAIATYWKALDLKPSDGMMRTALCQTLLDAGRTEVALRECTRATTDAPTYAPAFDQKGDVLRTMGKKADAIAAYQKAFELAPKGDLKESVRRKVIALGSADPALAGKRKDRWELPASVPDEVDPTLPAPAPR
jgi:superkiller protein 3